MGENRRLLVEAAVEAGVSIGALLALLAGQWSGSLRIGWWGPLLTPALGIAAARAIIRLGEQFEQWQVWRQCRSWPAKIMIEQDELGYVAYISAIDGSPSVLRLPDEFDPDTHGPDYVLGILFAD